LVVKEVIFLFQKLKEKQKSYPEKGITVLFSDSPFAVAIITPFMRRGHELESSREITFVDSISSSDAQNNYVTFILTHCAAGAELTDYTVLQPRRQQSSYSPP
jgi:hypothetical protein